MEDEDVAFIETALELDADTLYDVEHLSMQNMVELHYGAAQQLYAQGEDELGDKHVGEAHDYAENLKTLIEENDIGYKWDRIYDELTNEV